MKGWRVAGLEGGRWESKGGAELEESGDDERSWQCEIHVASC